MFTGLVGYERIAGSYTVKEIKANHRLQIVQRLQSGQKKLAFKEALIILTIDNAHESSDKINESNRLNF